MDNETKQPTVSNPLEHFVSEHSRCGAVDMSNSLGIQKMPQGYALMLNADRTHYYWLTHDDVESCINWDKWAIYRGAKANSTNEKD